VGLPSLELQLQTPSSTLPKGPLHPRTHKYLAVFDVQRPAPGPITRVSSAGRNSHALSFWLPCVSQRMGNCLGGGYQPELGCPPALALSPDVTSPDIWLSGLIELMLGGSWRARKSNSMHVYAHPASSMQRHGILPRDMEP
jgi:hypothetical protein